MNIANTSTGANPPFDKGGKRRAQGDLRELAVSFVILLQALRTQARVASRAGILLMKSLLNSSPLMREPPLACGIFFGGDGASGSGA